jgi:hypothetical protein
VAFQMGEVTRASREEVIDSHHGVAFGQVTVAHMRPNKTGRRRRQRVSG